VKSLEILLIEDNPADIRLTIEALRMVPVPHTMTIMKDGVEAMAYLRREEPYAKAPCPDIILLDLGLPRKNGWEVLEGISSDPALKHIPVVALTTSQDAEDVSRAHAFGVDRYVVKPSELDQYFACIQSIFSRYSSR
jgi:two-component system, chemotaxis family, response regulator Rcp1